MTLFELEKFSRITTHIPAIQLKRIQFEFNIPNIHNE